MAHKEPSWGFWIPVTNKSSAEYAAKMSGLPVFLLWLSFAASGLFQIFSDGTFLMQIIALSLCLSGAFFIVSGLRIRQLKFKTLPVSVGLWIVLNIAAIFLSGLGLGTLLTVLIGLMAACGLRGWYWLRKHESAPLQF